MHRLTETLFLSAATVSENGEHQTETVYRSTVILAVLSLIKQECQRSTDSVFR